MHVLASFVITVLEHSSWPVCSGDLESILLISERERLWKFLGILQASVKATCLRHSSLWCSEYLNILMFVHLEYRQNAVSWTLLFFQKRETVVHLPVLPYKCRCSSPPLFSLMDSYLGNWHLHLFDSFQSWHLCANGWQDLSIHWCILSTLKLCVFSLKNTWAHQMTRSWRASQMQVFLHAKHTSRWHSTWSQI